MNSRKIGLLVAVILFGSSFTLAQEQPPAPNSVEQPKSFKQILKKQVGADYLLFLPKDYRSDRSRSWPLILFLHGAGERGTNIWLVAKHGPPKMVAAKPDFPFIVVSPQCPAGRIWDPDVVMALLDQVIKKCRVDRAKIYLTGLSMGGYGTWDIGLTYPERFAALVPICGGGDPFVFRLYDKSRLEAVKTLPIWAFHGAKDSTVKLAESEKMVEAVKRVGGDVKLTVYPDAGHDSWTQTYNDPELYDWLLQHSRPAAPKP